MLRLEIHTIGDTSEEAYAAVVYSRLRNERRLFNRTTREGCDKAGDLTDAIGAQTGIECSPAWCAVDEVHCGAPVPPGNASSTLDRQQHYEELDSRNSPHVPAVRESH